MTAYELILPPWLDDEAFSYEAKGWVGGVTLVVAGVSTELVIYDPTRLAQEVGAAIESSGYFAEPHVLVVPRVTREEIERAVGKLAARGFADLR